MRLGLRLSVASVAVTLVTVPFMLLLVLVTTSYPPLHALDMRVAERLHDYALTHPDVVRAMITVTDVLEPWTWRALVVVAAAWLAYRGRRRLALWAVTTMAVGGMIGLAINVIVDRTRPNLPDPVSLAPGASFPSGHALNAALGAGVLALLVLPALSGLLRIVAWAVAVALAAGVAFTRVALGVHWLTDVLGAMILGAAIIAATAAAFETWRREVGREPAAPYWEGVEPEMSPNEPNEPNKPNQPDQHELPNQPALRGRPDQPARPDRAAQSDRSGRTTQPDRSKRPDPPDPPERPERLDQPDRAPQPARSRIDAKRVLRFIVLPLTLMATVTIGVGLLITKTSLVVAQDVALSREVAADRTDFWNDVTGVVSRFSDTPVIVAATAVVAVLFRLAFHRWRESVFLILAVWSQSLIFLLTTVLAERERPPVPHLDPAPPTSSYPSGHVSAAVAFYCGVALVLTLHANRSALLTALWWVLGLSVALGVAASRLYRGMHFLTDISWGFLLGAICVVVIGRAVLLNRVRTP